jgi:tetratricopeptide (TPR) repeat protein
MVQHAFSLAQRGATYTARNELVQSLHMIAQALDASAGTRSHSESLAAALRALDEGADFHVHGSRPETTPDLAALVVAHRTPVLKDQELKNATAVEAMQRYYAFAQEQFVAAAGGRRAASLALYGLGKLHGVLAEQSAAAEMAAPRAMVYHQAAMQVDPQNHLAANELGVLLAKYDQWEEAKRVLLGSIATHPMPQTWHNLAAVHQRLGQPDLAQQARNELEQLTRQSPHDAAPSGGPDVQWLTPEEFAATGEAPAPGSVALPGPAATSQAARPSDSLWWKPWTWF